MRTLKLTIAYDGAAYAGWQFQVDRPTVQDTLEKALEKVTGEAVRVLASGRTDAGVHALRQVVRFSTGSSLPPEVLCRALNANLPEDVAVLEVSEAPEGFHPISHVRRKRYRYLIHDGPVRDVSAPLRLALRPRPARRRSDAPGRGRLVGHARLPQLRDRRCARPTSVRTIFDIFVRRGRAGQGGAEGLGIGGWGLAARGGEPEIAGSADALRPRGWPDSDDFIIIEVEADGFLYNMVRTIVGTLVEVGRGRRAETWPGEVLRGANRRAAGPTAPPQGLFLGQCRVLRRGGEKSVDTSVEQR